jgi:membrane protein required for colicin V production
MLDIILGSLMLILIIRCALRGFIEEMMSMASLVLGVLAAVFFHKNGARFITQRFHITGLPAEILAFGALFLTVFIAVKLLEYVLRDIVLRVNLGGVDRFLGILFGIAEGMVLAALIVFLLRLQPLFDPSSLLRDSLFARLLLPLAGMVIPLGV